MPVDVTTKARIIASLVVFGMIVLILLALGRRGKYGVIEEERIVIAPVEAAYLPAQEYEQAMYIRPTVIIEVDPIDEEAYTEALQQMYR